jgi:hypothetical protein
MTTSPHALAPHHLPGFITAPGETDVLFWVMVVVVVSAIALIGVFYFKLHALPEHKAHTGQKFQYDLVAVLALLSLFTHNHIFWIAGLLLAFIPIPDFLTPMTGMARSLATMATKVTSISSEPDRPEPDRPEIDSVTVVSTIGKEATVHTVEKQKERAHG